jgi:hypothetical protein
VTADTIIEFIGLSWVDEVAFRGALDAHMTSSPMSRLQALNGTIDKVALPSALWRSVKRSAGVTKPEFDQYFRGAKCAFGIVVPSTSKLPLHRHKYGHTVGQRNNRSTVCRQVR